jgi:uncharacterized protein YdeI (YjbR/CyaY-like superfamily)
MEELYFSTVKEWREWLSQNYDQSEGIWLVYYKKESDQPTLDYEESVEQALCFGWVDSIIRKIDEEKYARKFTPRKDTSKWSVSNKKRVERLIKNNLMAEPGMAKIRAAKKNGMWDKPDRPEMPSELPIELSAALKSNSKAKQNFDALAPTHKKHYIAWIAFAKKPETRRKRVTEAVALLEKNEKLGLR